MLKIPQINPKASYLAYKKEIDSAIKQTLNSGMYILSHEVKEFENEFSSFIGSKYAVGVSNGTDAIELALRALNIGSGDIVFTVSHTAVATVAAIERTGATPFLVDIYPNTFTMNLESLEESIQYVLNNKSIGKVKAIVPVHIYGHPCKIDGLLNLSEKYNLKIIEDCAQAHGAKYHNKKVGTFGEMGTFSFYPTKNLGALGDAGIVVCQDEKTFNKIQALRQYGWRQRYISSFAGINSRLDELQAAILRVKLQHLTNDNEKRINIASQYNIALTNSILTHPTINNNIKHVFHQYVVKSDERDKVIQILNNNGICTSIHYPIPVHLQPAYRNTIPTSPDGLSNTEDICTKIFSLPMYPQLKNNEIKFICKILESL